MVAHPLQEPGFARPATPVWHLVNFSVHPFAASKRRCPPVLFYTPSWLAGPTKPPFSILVAASTEPFGHAYTARTRNPAVHIQTLFGQPNPYISAHSAVVFSFGDRFTPGCPRHSIDVWMS